MRIPAAPSSGARMNSSVFFIIMRTALSLDSIGCSQLGVTVKLSGFQRVRYGLVLGLGLLRGLPKRFMASGMGMSSEFRLLAQSKKPLGIAVT